MSVNWEQIPVPIPAMTLLAPTHVAVALDTHSTAMAELVTVKLIPLLYS